MIFAVASYTMLKTPITFSPLVQAQAHSSPLNFIFSGDALLVEADTLQLPTLQQCAGLPSADARWFPVGQLNGSYCQTTWATPQAGPSESLALDGLVWRKLRSLFGVMEEDLLAVAGRAIQIGNWARTHRFCGSCGAPTLQLPNERCMTCTVCKHAAYPRISPAMMVLVKRGRQILLAKHATSPAPFYTALAGFVEAGESVEETIHREVMEEVGLRVDNIRYFASQPWPFPHSLMIAYTAEYQSGDIQIDTTEIADARWFGPGDDLPLVPHSISIASSLIRANLP